MDNFVCPDCGHKFQAADERMCPKCHEREHNLNPLRPLPDSATVSQEQK